MKDNLKTEIIYQLAQQGITAGEKSILFILRYLDEYGEIIEPSEWIEMQDGEPVPLESLEPPEPSERSLYMDRPCERTGNAGRPAWRRACNRSRLH
jgi:hypothetical protein